MKAWNSIQGYQKWLYFSLLTIASTVVIFLAIPFQAQFKYDYRLGQVWLEDDLIAPTDFVLPKSPKDIEDDRNALIESKDYYYDYHFRIEEWQTLLRADTSIAVEFERWQNRGVVAALPGTNHRAMLIDGTRLDLSACLTPAAIRATYGLPENTEIAQTYTLNTARTDSALQAHLGDLSLNKGIITEGTPIVLRGATITAERFEVLKALEQNFDGSGAALNWQARSGAVLYILLIFIALAAYLNAYYSHVLAHSSSLNLFLFTFVAAAVATLIFASVEVLNPFAVPLVLVPVILRSFFHDRLALFTHFILMLLVAPFLTGAVHFLTVQFAAGLATIFNIRGIYKRSQLVQSTLRIMLVLFLVHFSYHLIRETEWNTSNLIPLASSLAGTLVLLFIFPLIYFFERTFGVVSDLTLLELSDTNNPLLKRLSKEAPGTFQHTMQVANLAEHATELVGGNTLLVRTGALYHDIGKIPNAQYFTENQSSATSPHDELSYIESAEIIIGHIGEGIELAKKYKLPDVVIDFIRTHHGTSRVEYFYRKYKADHTESELFESFQYPGPKPFSKETAIVMMSDAVEASTRSLPEKSQQALSDMIDRVIEHQLSSGQLDNADITLKEINIIREAFKKFMRGVYHVRVSYPEARES